MLLLLQVRDTCDDTLCPKRSRPAVDSQPGNILIMPDYTPKLADFGLSTFRLKPAVSSLFESTIHFMVGSLCAISSHVVAHSVMYVDARMCADKLVLCGCACAAGPGAVHQVATH